MNVKTLSKPREELGDWFPQRKEESYWNLLSPLLQKDIRSSTAEDMGVPDPRPGNQLWSFPFSVVRQGSTIQSIPVASYVDLETTQYSRIDASTLPATLPQQTTVFQHREKFSLHGVACPPILLP